MSDLTIVCVRWGSKFSKDYVNILHSCIKKNLDKPFKFICITDDKEPYDEGIESVEIPEGLTGWWGKLWMFSKEFQEKCTDRVWFFDLDTVITDKLDELSEYNGDFCILRDFYRHNGYGSGLMAWKKGYGVHIWDKWIESGKPELKGGDQEWVEHCVSDADLWQDLFPDKVVSYKAHAEQWPPSRSSIVCFHGFPNPHDCVNGWVPMLWSKDAVSTKKLESRPNVTTEYFLNNIRKNVKREIPWLSSSPQHNKTAVIVGGAPSLKLNYGNIKDRQRRGQVIFALNNTLDKLIENGITPDYLVMMDARPENAEFIKSRHDVKYLINAVCHDDVFNNLQDKDVTLWHSYIQDQEAHLEILNQYQDRPWGVIGTGNTVGLTTMILAYFLGFRKIQIYGMDSSYEGENHHAYKQKLNDMEATFTVMANNKSYKCSRWMMKQAEDFQNIFRQLVDKGCSITAHGSGLLPDVCRYMNKQYLHQLMKERKIG